MTFEPDKLMRQLSIKSPKVLFYPSSGNYIRGIFDMPKIEGRKFGFFY